MSRTIQKVKTPLAAEMTATAESIFNRKGGLTSYDIDIVIARPHYATLRVGQTLKVPPPAHFDFDDKGTRIRATVDTTDFTSFWIIYWQAPSGNWYQRRWPPAPSAKMGSNPPPDWSAIPEFSVDTAARYLFDGTQNVLYEQLVVDACGGDKSKTADFLIASVPYTRPGQREYDPWWKLYEPLSAGDRKRIEVALHEALRRPLAPSGDENFLDRFNAMDRAKQVLGEINDRALADAIAGHLMSIAESGDEPQSTDGYLADLSRLKHPRLCAIVKAIADRDRAVNLGKEPRDLVLRAMKALADSGMKCPALDDDLGYRRVKAARE